MREKRVFERRKAWLIVSVILLVAAAYRLFHLTSVPPGFQFDEAYNALDAVRVLEGQWPLFLEANGGREVLYTYLQALFCWLLGANVFALRFTSALVGLATILIAYPFVRTLFRRHPLSSPHPSSHEAVWIAALTAFLTAISYWHIHFSRYAIRGVTLPFLEIGCFYFLWRGVEERKASYYLWSGLFLGLMPYAHPAGRLAPVVVSAFLLYQALTDRPQAGRYLTGWGILALVSFVVFLPLGYYFWLHPQSFTGHPGLVSIFNPQVSGGKAIGAMASNLLAVAGMFTFRGDVALTHNLTWRPVFDPLLAVFFVLGVVVSLSSNDLSRYYGRSTFVFLWTWLVVMLAPSIFSQDAPNFSRTVGAIPAIFVFPALGMVALGRWLGYGRSGNEGWKQAIFPFSVVTTSVVKLVVLGLVLAVSAFWTYRDYFIVFPNEPGTYYAYDVDKIEAVDYLKQAVTHSHVYLTPLWAEHATVAFLARDLPLKSFDSGQTIVVPSDATGQDALYCFPAIQRDYVAAFQERLESVVRREEVPNRYGNPLMVVFRLALENLPDASRPLESLKKSGFPLLPEHVTDLNFGEEVKLSGYSLDEEEVPAGRPLKVTLFWQAPHRVSEDYTVFVHVLDDRHRKWGQQDARPNDGGYPTTLWEEGELVIDRYRPSIDPCASPGRYTLMAGLYSFVTGERLIVSDRGLDFAALGQFQVLPPKDRSLSNVAPQHLVEADFGDVQLWGYDRDAAQVSRGGYVGLTLYWQATEDVERDRSVAVALREARNERELWRGQPTVPTSLWKAGDQFCRHRDLIVPLDVPPGDYELTARLDDSNSVSLGSLTVTEEVRTFELPAPRYPSQALLGERVRFLGHDLAPEMEEVEPGGTLRFTLYWQAASDVEGNYKVFTHLLDAEGRVRGQRDSIPAGGARPTTGWIEGEVIADSYEMTVEAEAPPGAYGLEIGMYDALSGERLPLTLEGQRLPQDRLLLEPTIRVKEP